MSSGGQNPPSGATLIYSESGASTTVTVTGGVITISSGSHEEVTAKSVRLSVHTLEVLP